MEWRGRDWVKRNMENPGEHLVGQYLRNVKNCDFVEYNLQTVSPQGEIDVVGIDSTKKQIYICEVATHLETGMQYTKRIGNQVSPDNVERFKSKFSKNIEYAKQNFRGYKCHFMLWSPIIRIPKKEEPKNNQEKDLLDIQKCLRDKFGVTLKLVYNQEYSDCIDELREVAKNTTQEMSSPIMRFLQIEEKLKIHCGKINVNK